MTLFLVIVFGGTFATIVVVACGSPAQRRRRVTRYATRRLLPGRPVTRSVVRRATRRRWR